MAMIMYWLLRIGFALSRRMPLSWRYALGALGGEAVYWCWPAKRRNTRRNMAVVTGDPADGDGIAVQFFGRRTTVPAGAATLAAMTGAALVPTYLVRRRDGGYDGHILPP